MSEHDAAIAAHRYARGSVVQLSRSLAMPNVVEGESGDALSLEEAPS